MLHSAERPARAVMKRTAILLVCCALAGAAAGRGEPCAVDVAGTRGDCRATSQCPELLRKITRTPINRLRQLAKQCPWSAAGTLQICCQNEVTRTTPPPRVELPTEGQCGVQLSIPRIVGGEDVTIGEFPWMASMQYTNSPGAPLEHRCGGTLITSRHVLTAAHCVTRLRTAEFPELKPSAVVLGEVDFEGEFDCLEPDLCADKPITVEIDAIFEHPDYEKNLALALPYDIAVVRLAREVAFTDFILPVCLLTDLSVLRLPPGQSDVSSGQNGVVAGWGRSDVGSEFSFTPVLQKARVPIQEVGECETAFRQSLPRRICAGAGANGTDTCRGDSGGPLMVAVKRGVYWYQTGISSFGNQVCGNVAGYTRVYDYADWIVEQINK